MKPVFHLGIDVGSTTVKAAVLSPDLQFLFGRYARHLSDLRTATLSLLAEVSSCFPAARVTAAVSGSGGMGLSQWLGLPFSQEILAETKAISAFHPEVDAIIELGGEDEKVTYLKNGVDQRMNGACAGGTGAFIDRMAALLGTDAAGLGKLAEEARQIFPIASRCGVFAKTDIQALLNEGAAAADIAASVLQAVVNQTLSGLTCGRPLSGKIAFLGGPLTFLPALRKRFSETLGLTGAETIVPAHGELYVAMGAALTARHDRPFDFSSWFQKISSSEPKTLSPMKEEAPLFENEADYENFRKRHARFTVPRLPIEELEGPCWLGLDAGSTTIKAALLDAAGRLCYEFYASTRGTPLAGAKAILTDLYEKLPATARLCGAAVTGYGEELLKKALSADTGEVETIAHFRAAKHFCPDVDTVLDIGGQDMKCCRIKDGAVDDILLNEACSSGCGSFLDTFAQSLGLGIEKFAHLALFARHPADLGSRCTVFMNSRVREAQKNGISVADISAGLSYSVIKNALYKVIRLRDAKELGRSIVVQGGTFLNDAVLRALEKLLGREVIRPSIAGLMGAFGAALLARERCGETQISSLLSIEAIAGLTTKSETRRCPGCGNRCRVTITEFSDGRKICTGNRCERGASLALTGKPAAKSQLPNMAAWKAERLFSYRPLPKEKARRGTVGIPRALNMYEDYPFWFTFFTALGYRVILSPADIREIPAEAMDTIPSYSECYPAKLVHAHILALVKRKPAFIWYPCVDKGPREGNENSFLCPMVTSYPETIAANMDGLLHGAGVRFLHPFLPLHDRRALAKRMKEIFGAIPEDDISLALAAAEEERKKYRRDLRAETMRVLAEMREKNLTGIVLAGRPYHMDPAVHHGIPELINTLGMAVLTEDGLSMDGRLPVLRVLNQWTYHARLYRAADYVSRHPNLELVELNSFGCGLDAIVCDQVQEILRRRGRLYTALKIDEGANLGAVRIRLRSLAAALEGRKQEPAAIEETPYPQTVFTEQMRKDYTILVPEMSPLHFPLLEAAGEAEGYRLKVLKPRKEDIDTGLAFVNNDACYPAILTIGSLVRALRSGESDPEKTAVLLSQTGGACRASNYIALLSKALSLAGLSHVPILSANTEGLHPQPGFTLTPSFLKRLVMASIYGDALQQCLYRTRPYEKIPGAALSLVRSWQKEIKNALVENHGRRAFSRNISRLLSDFDRLPLRDEPRRPRIGIVGEIYVKFSPIASGGIAQAIEENGGEVEAGGLTDFLLYCLTDSHFQRKELGGSVLRDMKDTLARKLVEWYRRPYEKAAARSLRFRAPESIGQLARRARRFLSLGHRAGEGWYLTADMADLLADGCRGIVCLQPFACLPNHITGEGMLAKLRKAYPEAIFLSLDCDAGASHVNRLNRLKLMLETLTEEKAETQNGLRLPAPGSPISAFRTR